MTREEIDRFNRERRVENTRFRSVTQATGWVAVFFEDDGTYLGKPVAAWAVCDQWRSCRDQFEPDDLSKDCSSFISGLVSEPDMPGCGLLPAEGSVNFGGYYPTDDITKHHDEIVFLAKRYASNRVPPKDRH